MLKSIVRSGVAAASLLAFSGAAFAIPTLQLGIVGGTYNDDTDTVIAGSNPFQLVAILTLSGSMTEAEALAMNYYVSAALTPKLAPPGGDFGSFSFDGTTVDATADMTYGTPPLDDIYGALYGDLSPHGIFSTYFSEFEFTFASDRTLSCDVNTELNPGLEGCALGGAGGSQYYTVFDVDTSLLADYFLHFDLYNEKVACVVKERSDCTVEAVQIDDFAPFSHDAQSNGDDDDFDTPEPGTLALLGLGLLGLGMSRRRKI